MQQIFPSQIYLSYYQKDEILIFDAEYNISLDLSLKQFINELYSIGSVPRQWIEIDNEYVQVLPVVKYIIFAKHGYNIDEVITLSQLGLKDYSRIIIILDELLFHKIQVGQEILCNSEFHIGCQIFVGNKSLANTKNFLSFYDPKNIQHKRYCEEKFVNLSKINDLMEKMIQQEQRKHQDKIEQNSLLSENYDNLKQCQPFQLIEINNIQLSEIEQIIVDQVNNAQTRIKLEKPEEQNSIEFEKKLNENQKIVIENFRTPQPIQHKDDKTMKQIQSYKWHMIDEAIQLEIKQNLKENIITDPLEKVPQQLNVDTPELFMYVMADQFKQQNKTLYQVNQEKELNIYSLQASFGDETYDSQCQMLTLKETPQISIRSLSDDIEKERKFHSQLKQILAKQYNISPNEVEILGIEKGSIKVLFKIVGSSYTDDEKAREFSLSEIQRQFPGCQPELVLHKYFQQIQLSPNDFDYNYNMEWGMDFKEYEMRGPLQDQMKYFFPRGWKGYALKVLGKYDNGNDDWLSMKNIPNQWHIMFHGTDHLGCQGIQQTGFKPGYRQAYAQDLDIRFNQKIGDGVYFSNHIEVCEHFQKSPTVINGHQYSVVFMSRVRPTSLKQVKKSSSIPGKSGNIDWDNDYFVVNKSEDIRPYRILLKKN